MNFLLQALVILTLPLLCWWPARRLVPLVLFQILCGLALGPSLLGHWWPEGYKQLFPPGTLPALSGLSSLAVVCVGFFAGSELELSELRTQSRPIILTGLSSFLLPAAGGALFATLAWHQWPMLGGHAANPWLFAAAGGICFGVTALPVLVVIIRELGIAETVLGRTALTLAAMNDLLLWPCLSLLMLAVSTDHASPAANNGMSWLLLGTMGILVLTLSRYIWRKLGNVDQDKAPSTASLTVVLIALLAWAGISEKLGLHAVIGAFIAGALLPTGLRQQLRTLTAPFTQALLLPFFFVTSGLNIDINTIPPWSFFVASVVVGSALKISSTAVPARLWGWSWTQSLQLGALMQSRGLMEVIVLRLLYDAGIISQGCLSALMLMALVCTALAMPLTRWLAPSYPPVTATAAA